ncbi:MAG: phenylalanine--tRNA ligase subunit beta [Nitrososphaeria archaeon]
MPVVQLTRKRLEEIYSKRGYDEIVSMLPYLGLDIEDFQQDYIKVEYSPNRPDYSTDLGIVRGLKGLFGDELGIKIRKFLDGKVIINEDNKVKKIRPYIAGFSALNLVLNEDSIKQIISMQEDLHHGIGRERKKVAIGFHDFSVITPPITYTVVDSNFSFIPLNGTHMMTVYDILKETEQGRKYGYLLTTTDYPALIDSNGTVLSLPPIINGNATKISESTKNIFVDITGTDYEAVKLSASIIAETLWDMGASIIRGIVYEGGQGHLYPDTSSKEIMIEKQKVNQMLGINLSDDDLILSLLKCRLEPQIEGDYLKTTIPHYRGDILHPVDIVEEVMLGYGLFKIKPDSGFYFKEGSKLKDSTITSVIRSVLVGLGFNEVVNPILTSEALLIKNMKRDARVYTVSFSKSIEHNMIRDLLLPGCIKVISSNQQEPSPHRFFEIGEIVLMKDVPHQIKKLCFIEESQNTTMTTAKSYVEAINKLVFRYKLNYINSDKPYSLRAATVMFEDKIVGEIGEVHPEVLERFKIKNPVIYGELFL